MLLWFIKTSSYFFVQLKKRVQVLVEVSATRKPERHLLLSTRRGKKKTKNICVEIAGIGLGKVTTKVLHHQLIKKRSRRKKENVKCKKNVLKG